MCAPKVLTQNDYHQPVDWYYIGMTEQPPSSHAQPPGQKDANDLPRLIRHGDDLVSSEFLDRAQLHYFSCSDGERLRTAYWAHTETPARGTIMILAGFSEFIEKYYETARDLNDLGFAVFCFDWRGQGLSTRAQADRRGWVQSYETMMQDVIELTGYCKELAAPEPLFALAHSMGGNVLLRLLQHYEGLFTAAAVTSPMLGIMGMPTWLLGSITHTGSRVGMDERYAPGAKDNDPNGPHIPLCADAARIKVWRNYLRTEPLLITHGATWRWAREAATSMSLVNQPANIERITTPLLIANAMQDSLVDPEPTKKFAAICKCAQSLELEDAQHEVLQEIDSIRDLFFEAFDKFISQIQTETQGSTSTPKASATER